jgi:hypothetical protein
MTKNLNKLTKTQLQILYLLYRFRFLTRTQIQTLLNHKVSHRIKAWLKDLTEKEFLARIYTPDAKNITKPAIYYLTSKSIPLLKENKDLHKKIIRKFYREMKRSEEFIEKCLIVADIYLHFLSNYQKENPSLNFYTESDLVEFDYLPNPTCYVSIEQISKKTVRYFIEVIDSNTNKYQRELLIKKYLDYLDEDTWGTVTQYPFPVILLVTSDQRLKRSLEKHLEESVYEQYEKNEILFKTIPLSEFIGHS